MPEKMHFENSSIMLNGLVQIRTSKAWVHLETIAKITHNINAKQNDEKDMEMGRKNKHYAHTYLRIGWIQQ